MPRNAETTRDRLLTAGRARFASEGVYQASLAAIVADAGQRNASALHYHFKNRDGLLAAIISIHDEQIEAERRDHLAALDAAGLGHRLEHLVAALVVPFSRTLLDPAGREFLLVIAQLSSWFDAWDQPGSPEQAHIVFSRISDSLEDMSEAVRHLRVTTFLDLVTQALAARARLLASGGHPPLDHAAFVANLVAMSVGALAAPPSLPIPLGYPPKTSPASSGSNSSV